MYFYLPRSLSFDALAERTLNDLVARGIAMVGRGRVDTLANRLVLWNIKDIFVFSFLILYFCFVV